jgi:hypothetical protein
MQGSARTLYLADRREHVRSMVVRVSHIALYRGLASFGPPSFALQALALLTNRLSAKAP